VRHVYPVTAIRPEVKVAMRGFVRTLAAVVVTSAFLAVVGCASSPGTVASPPTATSHPVVKLDEHANQSTVRVTAGSQVEVLLHSSYWTDFGSSKPAVVRADGAARVLPATQTCVPGGGCRPVLATFTAVTSGTAVLSASRTTCGEALRCGPGNSHYRVTIIVSG
jgi:hypothetical protein